MLVVVKFLGRRPVTPGVTNQHGRVIRRVPKVEVQLCALARVGFWGLVRIAQPRCFSERFLHDALPDRT